MTALERRGAFTLACMAALIVIALLMWLMSALAADAQQYQGSPSRDGEQSRSFYDQRGSFAGSSVTRGNTTSFTDRNGRFDGTAIRNSDGTTSYYDRRGHFCGIERASAVSGTGVPRGKPAEFCVARAMMSRIAEDYERLAEHAQRRATRVEREDLP
jgi:hypothetical protein